MKKKFFHKKIYSTWGIVRCIVLLMLIILSELLTFQLVFAQTTANSMACVCTHDEKNADGSITHNSNPAQLNLAPGETDCSSAITKTNNHPRWLNADCKLETVAQANADTQAANSDQGVVNRLAGAAGTALNTVAGPFVMIITIFLGVCLMLLSILFDIVFDVICHILLIVLKFNHFTDIQAVIDAWKMIRDLSNMFFIVIVLFIAFGTMLRLEHYEWKHLLPKLVFAALLINFSRTICSLFIDVGQVVMLTFSTSFTNAGIGNFQHVFGVTADLFGLVGESIKSTLTLNWDATLQLIIAGVMLLSFFYLVVGTMIVFSMLGYLVFRIVALWVLVIFSPLAFVLSAFPQGEEFFEEWKKNLTSNIIVGPVIAFFIWLVLYMQKDIVFQAEGGANKVMGGLANGSINIAGASKNTFEGISNLDLNSLVTLTNLDPTKLTLIKDSFDPARLLNMVLSVAILMVGMKVAGELGSAGADKVEEASGEIAGVGKWMAGGAFNTYDRFAANVGKSVKGPLGWIATATSLKSIKGGYEKFRHVQDHETYSGSEEKVQDMLHAKFNPTAGLGRKFAEWWESSTDLAIAEIDAKIRSGKFNEEEIKALNAEKEGHLKWRNRAAWAKYEGISGSKRFYTKIAEEKSIQEAANEFAATNFTAEQLAGIVEQNEGNGNIHFLQGLQRTLITGNNQDDYARVLWASKLRELLTNAGGRNERLLSELDNKTIQILMANAERDQERVAGAGEHGNAKTFNRKLFDDNKQLDIDELDAKKKSGQLTDAQYDQQKRAIEDQYNKDTVTLFGSADGKTVTSSFLLNLQPTRDVKTIDPVTKAEKIDTKTQMASAASQSDLLSGWEKGIKENKVPANMKPQLEAILRSYKHTKQTIYNVAPPEHKASDIARPLTSHYETDETATVGDRTKWKEIKQKIEYKTFPAITIQGISAPITNLQQAESQQLTNKQARELKEKLMDSDFYTHNGLQRKSDDEKDRSRRVRLREEAARAAASTT